MTTLFRRKPPAAPAFRGEFADLLICRNGSALAWAIRQTQRTPGETATWANHVAGLVAPGTVLHALVHVVEQPLATLGGSYEVWRHRHLSLYERAKVAQAAGAFEGREYGVWKLLPHLADWGLSWALAGLTLGYVRREVFLTRRLLCINRFPICSWVWAQAYSSVQVHFGRMPNVVNPDHMHDWVRSHPADWELVHSHTPA